MSLDCVKHKGKLVFVMGGGNFGTRALKYLKAKGARVLVADVNPECRAMSEVDVQVADFGIVDFLGEGQAALLVGDAVDLLIALLETKVPDRVVTAIPVNAVAEVVESWLAKHGYSLKPYKNIIPRVLENLPKSLISFIDRDSAVIATSYMPAHKRCNEDCIPPKDFCASTGRPKLTSMDKLLEFSVSDLMDTSRILRSRQLTAGVGAIEGKDLYSLLKRLENLHKAYTLAVGTACGCHGVLSLTKVSEK